jgi:hypothetical protein
MAEQPSERTQGTAFIGGMMLNNGCSVMGIGTIGHTMPAVFLPAVARNKGFATAFPTCAAYQI